MKFKLNKKGVVSSAAIYGFFIVFILIMLSIIMSFANKRFLIGKVKKTGAKSLVPEETLKATCAFIENNYIDVDGNIVDSAEKVAETCIRGNECSTETMDIGGVTYYQIADGSITTNYDDYEKSCACMDTECGEVTIGSNSYYCSNYGIASDYKSYGACQNICDFDGFKFEGTQYFKGRSEIFTSLTAAKNDCTCYGMGDCSEDNGSYCYNQRPVTDENKTQYFKSCAKCADHSVQPARWKDGLKDGLYIPLKDGSYGNIMDNSIKGKESNCTCTVFNSDSKDYYFDNEGKVVSKSDYEESGCVTKCDKKDGVYYNDKGQTTTYERFVKSCEFPCESGKTPFNECLIYMEKYHSKLGELKDVPNYSGLLIPENNDPDKDKQNFSSIETVIKGRTEPTFANSSTVAEGLYKTIDDLGDVYYYRGDVSYNYVKFNEYIWRIVRTNGDNSVRIILEDVPKNHSNYSKLMADAVTTEGSSYIDYDFNKRSYSATYKNRTYDKLLTHFNDYDEVYKLVFDTTSSISNKTNVGIKYAKISNLSAASFFDEKDEMWANDNNSTIQNVLDNFYSSYISADSKKAIEKNSTFFADKNISSSRSEGVDNLVEEACNESYGWKLNKNICENPLLDIFSTVKYKMTYYDGFFRAYNSTPLLIPQESCKTAKSICHKNVNLSKYSVSGHSQYGISSRDDMCDWTVLDTKHCAACTKKCVQKNWLGVCTKYGEWNEPSYQKIGSSYDKLKSSYFYYREDIYYKTVGNIKDATTGQKSTILTYKNNLMGNGALVYPVGLISADELILSGAKLSNNNSKISSAISSDTFRNYWTSTAAFGDYNRTIIEGIIDEKATSDYIYNDSGSMTGTYYLTSINNNIKLTDNTYLDTKEKGGLYARPVINLRSCVRFKSGTGTKTDPFEIDSTDCVPQ